MFNRISRLPRILFGPRRFLGGLAAGWAFLIISASPGWGSAASVSLNWNPNSEPDIAGYRLYYGTASGSYDQIIEAGNVTSITAPELTSGVTYFFAVTAFNVDGLESLPSDEVSYTPLANQPPQVTLSVVGGQTIREAPASFTLAALPGDTDGAIDRVEFYRDGILLGQAAASPYEIPLADLAAGVYQFTARAFDNAGDSADSTPVEVIVATRATPGAGPAIGAFRKTAEGLTAFTLYGDESHHRYRVLVSDDLIHWAELRKIEDPAGPVDVIDPESSSVSSRFYRILAE